MCEYRIAERHLVELLETFVGLADLLNKQALVYVPDW